MVLRVRVRNAKILVDYNTFTKMSTYCVLIGGGKRFRTETDSHGGKDPVWEELITFPNCPPNLKVQVWVEKNDGDILAGEVLVDLCNFYQREPYRIQPKQVKLGLKRQASVEIKIELDFDFDGMTEDQFNRLKTEGKKPEQRTDLHIGTVVAQGKKGNNKEFHEVAENPKRNPQTANNNYNYNYSPPKQHKPQTAQQNNQQPPQDNGLWNVMGQLLMNKKGPPNNHHQGTNQGNVPRTANHGWDM